MKIGRNDPCPCGSGRKYKHCCLPSDEAAHAPFRADAGADGMGPLSEEEARQMMLAQTDFASTGELDAAMKEYREHCESLPDHVTPPTFMEFLGRPNLATQTQKGVAAAMAGKEFGSLAEAKQFARNYAERENVSPVVDFEGLSSEQMHRILTLEFGENTDMVELADDLPDREALSAELRLEVLDGQVAGGRGAVASHLLRRQGRRSWAHQDRMLQPEPVSRIL